MKRLEARKLGSPEARASVSADGTPGAAGFVNKPSRKGVSLVVAISKLGSNPRAWLLGAIALALTVPVAAGQGRTQTGQAPPTGSPQGRQAVAPPKQDTSQPSGPSRQGPPPWWKDDAVKKEIGLSDHKAKQIDRIFEDWSKRMEQFLAEFRKQEDELDRLTRERTVDESTYAVQVARVEDMRRRLRESRTVTLYRIYLELTPDQHKKLQVIRERNRNGRGGGSR